MFRDSRPSWIKGRLTAVVAVVLAVGCSAEADLSQSGGTGRSVPGDEADLGPVDAAQPGDQTALVSELKSKSGRRYVNSLAAALDLPAQTLCRELGELDCLDVHGISLQEVEPRFLRVQSPINGLVTGAVALDRIAILSCDRHVRNQGGPPTDDTFQRREAIDSWARRLLRRDATELEQEKLEALYEELQGESDETQWSTAVCFIFATLTESFLY